KRLTENNSQHEEIESLRSLGNPKEKLEEAYDKGGTKLNKEDWYTVDFSDIEDWKEATKNKRAIEFYAEKVNVSSQFPHVGYYSLLTFCQFFVLTVSISQNQ
ncbi:hypothetical protein ACT4UT_22500, partial [Bacillus sp. B-TM1]